MSRLLDIYNDGSTGEEILRLPRRGGRLVVHRRLGEFGGARIITTSGPDYITSISDIRTPEIDSVRDALAVCAEAEQAERTRRARKGGRR